MNDKYPLFASEERNMRLGLSTDGFKSFNMKNTTFDMDIDIDDVETSRTHFEGISVPNVASSFLFYVFLVLMSVWCLFSVIS